MDKLFWLDLETTGLNEKEDSILEVGVILTDWNMNILHEESWVVKQPNHKLSIMNPFVKKMHTENGLLVSCALQGEPLDLVETKVVELVSDNFPKKKPIMAGGGIHFDRRFIKEQMKGLDASLHYRMLDVSALNLLFGGLGYENLCLPRKKNHRSLDDIRESIDELKSYIEHMKVGFDNVAGEK